MSDFYASFIPGTLLGNALVPDGKTKAVEGSIWSSGIEDTCFRKVGTGLSVAALLHSEVPGMNRKRGEAHSLS